MITWLKQYKLRLAVISGLLLIPAVAYGVAVSALTALTGANTASGDLFLTVDISEALAADRTKNITRDELAIGLGGPMGIVVESAPGTAPTATGTDAIGIGDGAVAGDAAADDGVLAIGARSTATGDGAIAIGENTDSTGTSSIAIGGNATDATSADATADNAIAIGINSLADATEAIAIGDGADAGGIGSIAIGDTTLSDRSDTIAIGTNATATTQTTTIAIGKNASSSGVNGIALGQKTDATGANCIAIGGNATDGDSADCTAADSIAIGQHILADDIGEFAFASGEFAAQSDAHTSIFVLRNNTTDATQTELFADGSAGDISVPSDCTTTIQALITARQTDADDVSAGYSFSAVFDNNAGTTAIVGAIASEVVIGEDVAGWSVTTTADDTNDGINILVTGAVGDAVRWVARVEVVEVCG